jgi:hypothetical protein
MDANRNHKRPHIHIDYKEEYHSASYAIDTGERLAGRLGTQYDQLVRRWISGCRPKLLEGTSCGPGTGQTRSYTSFGGRISLFDIDH